MTEFSRSQREHRAVLQEATARLTISEIRGSTGNSKHWGKALREFSALRGDGTGPKDGLTSQQQRRFREIKESLESVFGHDYPGFLDVVDEWNHAEVVRNASIKR